MAARVKEHRTSLKRKRDNYAFKLRRKKLIKYLRSELRSCTTHGLPYIVFANMGIHWSERLFWAFSFVFSLGVIVFLLSMQYSRYKNTPTVTSVEMDYFNWNVSYPAITLCPLNKIEEDELYNFVNETLEFNGEDIESHLRALCSLSMDSLDVIDYNELKLSSSVYPKDHAALASMLFKKFDNNSLTTSTNWPISVEIAMTEMGMCHVINSNVAVFHNPMKWDTTQYVKSNIDLSVYDRDFFVQMANYADIYKVFIHSPDEIVLSTTPSYTSKRKSFIHFGVQVWSTRISSVLKATPINIRKCRFIDEPISQRYPIYTYNHCILECKIHMILSVCDCLPHFYKPLENERICNMTELHCFREHKNAFIKLSASESLAKNFSNTDLPRSPRDCSCLTTCESHVFRKDQENFLPEPVDNRIRISISSYPKVRVVRDFIFNAYDFILRGAGVINLCVGASIISIMELILLTFKVLLQTVWSYKKYLCTRMTIHPAFANWIKRRIIKKQH